MRKSRCSEEQIVAILKEAEGGSVTHHFNTEQRVLGLTKSGNCGVIQGTGFKTCTFTVTAPEDGNHAPPGYYMLFALNEEGQPSVAEFVQLL